MKLWPCFHVKRLVDGINARPLAAFLLDKSGRLVALGARGAHLEALVRQYLGLP